MTPDIRPIPPSTRQRLERAILNEVERLKATLHGLRLVDHEVFQAGMAVQQDEPALALWLVQPTYLLKGRVPLSVIAQEGGRDELLRLLRAWKEGDLFE